MKLGISYNLFDGEELIEGSLKQIKECVDYISVVYQTISNYGHNSNPNLESFLKQLKEDGIVNEILKFEPNLTKSPHFNEIQKRNIGLQLSKNNGCTHHMSMDTDEYYLKNEFINLKTLIDDNGYDSTYCQMLTYYKTWEYVLDPPEIYYVPLIYSIKENHSYSFGSPCPVLVDPTRSMSGIKKPIILERNIIQMHHGSYIRNDIKMKFINSSALVNFSSQVDKLVEHFSTWTFPEQVLMAGSPCKLHNVKKVDFFGSI